jgi:release factor glutamine methyltransferase
VTIAETVVAAAEILRDAGFEPDEARRDVSVLARHELQWNLADWAARSREDAPDGFAEQLNALARRRATREPVAYITGVREFFGREFRVAPGVLIPRPETEAIVEHVVSRRERFPAAPVILDIGTGSGCLAVTVSLELPHTRVVATDTATVALGAARANAERLGASVEFVQASLIPAGLQPDVIVSNPPYVPERDRASLSADVRDFEPATALFSGPDGLDLIRELLPAAARQLNSGGWLFMEIGAGQSSAVADLVGAAGLDLESVEPDLQKIPRIVIARRPVTTP